VAADFGEGSGEFDSSGTGTDDHEVQRIAGFAGRGLALCKFEGQQNAAADFECVLDRLETRRESLPFVVAEIGVAGASGDDEGIVGNFLRFGLQYGFDHAAFEVEAGDLGHEHFYVLMMPQNRSDRSSDLAGGEAGSRHLIEERLKGMMIFPIDDGHAYRCASQRLGSAQPPEARSHNHDAMCCWMFRLAVHSLADQAPTL
jgi:hypothetical protein